jgi:hypothetical protein
MEQPKAPASEGTTSTASGSAAGTPEQ